MSRRRGDPLVALLPWGLVLEDFLEPHGLTLDDFCREFRGSWMFGYVEALRSAGVRTLIVALSRTTDAPTRRVHEPSGADVLVLPAPRAFRVLRRWMANPYGRSAAATFRLEGPRRLLWPLAAVAAQIAPYMSTPRRLLGRWLVDSGCSAILCQEYEFPRFDASAAVSRRTGIPLFATFQGGDYRRWRLERFARPRSMRRCRGLIIASETEIERVVTAYDFSPDRIARIPNPVDVEAWRPGDRSAARARLGISPSERVAVWHGRTHMWKKGLDVLLDVWPLLCRDVEDARLVLVGEGPDAGTLAERVDRAPGSSITFVRRLVHDQAELREYLVSADVYVFPSRHEGFAVAPLEAMACGLPVVAADAAGIREAVGEGEDAGGVVVGRDDPAALRRELRHLLVDPVLAREVGERARRRTVDFFSYAAVGERLASFLAVSEPGSP